jgi:archaellum component FlaF (FlaF/FlaG flagellin family)
MNPKSLFFSRSRTGLSEVVAAVVLTLASLVAIAMAFATGMLRVAPAATSTGLLVSAHLEPFGGGGLLEVTVYNVGKEPLNLEGVRLLDGGTAIWATGPNRLLKPSTSWSDTFVVSGVSSGRVYIVQVEAKTQRSQQTLIIGSTEVVMR